MTMASSSAITSATLNYINHKTYPDSEQVSSTNLSSDNLSNLLSSLQQSQQESKDSIRSLSKAAAPDIDSWISRAKALQDDIRRSRETAREIVAEAEAARNLRSEVEDKANKIRLLEKEVGFNENLAGTLEHVQHANGLLEKAQEAAVEGNVTTALQRLEDAEASILGLESLEGSRAVEILKQKAEELKGHVRETTTEFWNATIRVDNEARTLDILETNLWAPGADISKARNITISAAKAFGIFDSLVQALAQNIDRSILRPRMTINEDEMVPKVFVSEGKLYLSGQTDDLSCEALVRDITLVCDFLATRLPLSITLPLSNTLIPALSTRLEEQWLEPAIPKNMPQTASFTATLSSVRLLADCVDKHEWYGSKQLRDWVNDAPRTWLTKRREVVLGDVRNLVFEGVRERKTVERVETRVVSQADVGGLEEDDWDNGAWNEPEESAAPAKSNVDGDDDASAWDIEDDKSEKDDQQPKDIEDDAWGWGDEDADQKPSSPVSSKKHPPNSSLNGKPADQEMTLRETFTTTTIPDGIVSHLREIVSDAETLSEPDFASSPIAPAAQALYTLPTLALAIYRATAPTAYGKVDVGNMLIYNDSTQLADKLKEWQHEVHNASGAKLRLDADVVALESFAKRAYSTEMESQRTILKDLLDGAQAFGHSTEQPYQRECEAAVSSTVERLRDVWRMWKDVLSQGALLQSLGSLLSSVTGQMTREIEDLGDISEAESKQLRILCDQVTTITDIFTQPPAEGEEGNPRDMTFVYSPTWIKFQYLAEVLESSLADIRWMWKEGSLRLEFESEEVVELVEALFAESRLRREAVDEIRGS